jgi:hypothetical protein
VKLRFHRELLRVPSRLIMLISDSKHFIFIRLPKTAGSSIESALSKFGTRGTSRMFNWHVSASEAKSVLQRWDDYFKFGFVRNPREIQISMYNYVLGMGPQHPQYHEIAAFSNVSEYVKVHLSRLFQTGRLRTQADLLCDDTDKCLVDFVGRFESLQSDFRFVCRRLRLGSLVLPYLNRSFARAPQSSLDFEATEIIAAAYKRDLKVFDYRID